MTLSHPEPASTDPAQLPHPSVVEPPDPALWHSQTQRLAAQLQETRAAYARLEAQYARAQAELIELKTGLAGRVVRALQLAREGLAPDHSLRRRLLDLGLGLLVRRPTAAPANAPPAAPAGPDEPAWERLVQQTRAAVAQRRGALPEPRSLAPAEAPLVSVIVLNLNGQSVLGRCLDHLLAQRYPNFEIIVVDNASTDGSVELLQAYLASGRLTIVRSPVNCGCPGGRNLGLQYARGEVVAFIDNDGYAQPDWLAETVRILQAQPDVGAVAPLVFFDRNKLILNGAGGTVNQQGYGGDLAFYEPFEFAQLPAEVLYPMGCGMVLRRSVLDRIAPLDDALLNYYDDTEVGFRVWAAGFRVVVAHRAWVDHGFNYTSRFQTGRASLTQRGRIRTVLKYFPARRLARFVWREFQHVLRNGPLWPVFLGAWWWNLLHLGSALRLRSRYGAGFEAFERLSAPGWGWFPTTVPTHTLYRPRLADLAPLVFVGNEGAEHLGFGWYWPEVERGVFFRWTAAQAAVPVRLRQPGEWLQLACRPAAAQALRLSVRRLGELESVWTTIVDDLQPGPNWQFLTLVCPLPAGEYELLLQVDVTAMNQGRVVGAAVARIEFR